MSLPYTANRAENSTPPKNRPLDETSESRVEALAAAIEKRGMAGVAPLLLRTFRPASWAGGQLLWVLQPFFGSGANGTSGGIASLASFLEQEDNIEALISRLDRNRPDAGGR